jgi:hypothetical protein
MTTYGEDSMKKLVVLFIMIISLTMMPQKSDAASSLQIVAEDALWGCLIGTLVGTATLAFHMDDAGDHLENIAYGASIGLFAGVGFGVYELRPLFQAYKDPVSKDTVYSFKIYMPLK